MTFMMGFWQIVMTKHSLFERFSYYTMLFVVLAVPEAIKAFRSQLKNNLREKYLRQMDGDAEDSRVVTRRVYSTLFKVMAVVYTLVVLSSFAYNLIGLIVPEKGVHGVLPYQTQNGMDIPNIDWLFEW